MPLKWEIFHDQKLVHIVAQGQVTLPEMEEHFDALAVADVLQYGKLFDATAVAWSDLDCRQSRIAAWQGMKCRATNVVTMEGNIGVFRQWAAFGTTREGYYAHMFVWEAQNNFSHLSAEETTADFVKWMFEHGKSISQVSPVARYKDSDYVTFETTSTAGCASASVGWAGSNAAV